MINSLSTYADAGRKCGLAARRRDESLRRSLSDWARRAFRCESSRADQLAAEAAFNAGYRGESEPNIPQPIR